MNPDSQQSSRAAWWAPWRSTTVGVGLTVVLLVIGLPLFLRMPPWCDLTLYDVAARNIMSGGVHYRDVFDTNLPGFVWTLVGIRRIFGPSTEAVRLIDLAIVGTICVVLARLAKAGGATRRGLAWFAVGVAAYYPFTTEFCHTQRDVWMLLPALFALCLRLRRITREPLATPRTFWDGWREGLLWGVAVWIKPHVMFPALCVWLISMRWLPRGAQSARRTIRNDFLGNLAGGSLLGIAGVAWLVLTGTWKEFLEVFLKWNSHYMQSVFDEFAMRAADQLFYFVPWSFLQPLAILFAILDLTRGRFGSPNTTAPPYYFLRLFPAWLEEPTALRRAQMVRTLLAALYLGWVAQSLIVQRRFHYVHVPETLLMFAIFATRSWATTAVGLSYLVLSSGLQLWIESSPQFKQFIKNTEKSWPAVQEYFPKHPLAESKRMAQWGNCWRSDLSVVEYRQRSDAVALLYGSFPSVGVVEIGEVADYLRTQNVRDGEVLCWHDSPHAVYLELGIKPQFRFMHVTTTLMSETTIHRMMIELKKTGLPPARFVVSDLRRLYLTAPDSEYDHWRETSEDLYPPGFTAKLREAFPYNQPPVFRSGNGHGRYVVHKVMVPLVYIEYQYGAIWNDREPEDSLPDRPMVPK